MESSRSPTRTDQSYLADIFETMQRCMQDVVQGLSQVYVHVPRIGPYYAMRITRNISLQLVVCHFKENLEVES